MTKRVKKILSHFVIDLFRLIRYRQFVKTLTINEVANEIGVNLRTLYRMIDDKRFPVKPIKGTKPRRWAIEAIDAWRGKK